MFIQLHNHTDYSALDGDCQIPQLVAKAVSLQHKAIAITDHGNMNGVYAFYKECKKQNIQPIYGIEFYHKVQGYDKRFHIIAYAKTQQGLKNLYTLHELTHLNKEKQYPILTYEMLFKYSKDIIITTACLGGYIPYLILNNQLEEANYTIEMLKKHFQDDFYIEIQANSLPEQIKVNNQLIHFSKLHKIKVIATNDLHYINPEDAIFHEMLLCMQTQKKMADIDRYKFPSNDFWFKSEEDMLSSLSYLNKEDAINAINNTIEIADKCKFDFPSLKSDECLPKFGKDENKLLRDLVNKGYKEKIVKTGLHSKETFDRTKYELEIIEQKQYAGYYLIVQDYINWAKDNNIIVGPGRGSGVGSFVGYLIGMTSINPMQNGLLFERFLNPERYTSPDFDVDFSNQEAVVQYLSQKWGDKHISHIIAFGTLTAKAVIRNIMRIHGFTEKDINLITKSLPKKLELTLKDCEASSQFVSFCTSHPLLANAMYHLEGKINHTSLHAAGILITPNPVSHYCPVGFSKEFNSLVSGFDKYMLEELGLFKFDILKLTTLTAIDYTLQLIHKNTGKTIDLDNIDYEDKHVYNSFNSGSVFGIFQLEEQGELTKTLRPSNFSQLTALNAQIRPGVGDVKTYIERLNGLPYKTYGSEPYMDETLGVITYQEQIMLRVNKLAGWSLGKGDSLRKEKHISLNTDLRNKYIEDTVAISHLTKEDALESWIEICDALEGGYSFNKSHACSYAKIAYQTAWLRFYYPNYFMTALMSAEINNDNKPITTRIMQCKQLGIPILPPDINLSEDTFIVDKTGIRFAINTISGVGVTALEEIKHLKPIKSLTDLLNRGNLRVLNKSVITALISAGCFDFSNSNRFALLEEYHGFRGDKVITQMYHGKVITNIQKANMEKDVLGVYITSNPLDDFFYKPLTDYQEGENAIVCGEIIKHKSVFDKNNNKMSFVTLATKENNVEIIIFASQYNQYQDLLEEGVFIMVNGRKDKSKVIANTIRELEI